VVAQPLRKKIRTTSALRTFTTLYTTVPESQSLLSVTYTYEQQKSFPLPEVFSPSKVLRLMDAAQGLEVSLVVKKGSKIRLCMSSAIPVPIFVMATLSLACAP
jgi:hypothetical protein